MLLHLTIASDLHGPQVTLARSTSRTDAPKRECDTEQSLAPPSSDPSWTWGFPWSVLGGGGSFLPTPPMRERRPRRRHRLLWPKPECGFHRQRHTPKFINRSTTTNGTATLSRASHLSTASSSTADLTSRASSSRRRHLSCFSHFPVLDGRMQRRISWRHSSPTSNHSLLYILCCHSLLYILCCHAILDRTRRSKADQRCRLAQLLLVAEPAL